MKFLYPVPPNSIVTQTFAEHVWRAKVNGWQNYNGGIDWAVFTGTPIKAAQAGSVVSLRTDATGYGTHVRLQHDEGFLTIYGHMSSFKVQQGDSVKAGDIIGLSDNTGNSTGPHLHFELRQNNVAIDPAVLLVTELPADGSGEPPGGGTGETPGEGEGETPSESGTEPKKFPKLPKAKVTSSVGLNIRMGPSITTSIVGFLARESEVEVIRKVVDGENLWLQIGYNQYIAMKAAGEILAAWL
jgi:murein DD-endopeptidase MepM/ murein hydrolase activator NlpD